MVFLSCSKPMGQFGFKYPMDKGYLVKPPRYEFDCNKKLLWIYSFPQLSSRIDIGIVIMKKKLFWVDVFTKKDYVDSEKKIIYGEMEGYEPGNYKIIITEIEDGKTRTIGECPLYLFSDSDSD